MSSFVIAAPEVLAAASQDFAGIGSAIRAANAAAAGSTTRVLAAAGDEVSAAISDVFGGYAQQYQALSARAALFGEQFVQAVHWAAGAYAGAEAANVSPLQALVQQAQSLAVFSPWGT